VIIKPVEMDWLRETGQQAGKDPKDIDYHSQYWNIRSEKPDEYSKLEVIYSGQPWSQFY
jgi:hypothetical protein